MVMKGDSDGNGWWGLNDDKGGVGVVTRGDGYAIVCVRAESCREA